MKTRKCFWKGETHMLTDLLELLLDVSIWEADNPRISTRRHRIFQGHSPTLFACIFGGGWVVTVCRNRQFQRQADSLWHLLACLHRHHLQSLFIKRKRTVGDNKEERANALSSFVAHRQFCAVVLIYPTAHGKQPIMEILPQGVGGVSTHALRTEGNRANSLFPRSRTDFYPRPSAQRATSGHN